MNLGKIEVEIEGLSPLLMHRCNPDDLVKTPKKKTQTYDLKEIAREQINFTLNDSSLFLMQRFDSFYSDLVKFKESKREVSAIEKVKLLDIASMIGKICS